ncbi:hypothetical protein OAD66_07570 [Bacteroidia bacterium]|nr:hypothetical protein [Bacteroidia bacterium]MDB9882974.1 hypothetical protein [Bacteroidia bacterium]
MKRGLFLFILAALFFHSYGQKRGKNTDFSYGLTPILNKSVVGKNFEPNLGYGLGLYLNYDLNSSISLTSSVTYSLFKYTNSDSNLVINSGGLGTKLGVKKYIKQLDNSAFIVQAHPMYILHSESYYAGVNNVGPKSTDLLPLSNRRLAFGLYSGFELNFNGRSSLEIGYTYILNNTSKFDFIDAAPHSFSLSYNIDFSLKRQKTDYREEARQTLSALRSDTLYFIDRTCTADFRAGELDSLIKENYTYSAYRLLKDNEIAAFQKNNSVVHFAVIGKYYASKGDPLTNGIYLLDSALNLTKHPYPFYTKYSASLRSGLCFPNRTVTAELINTFSRRLSIR